MAIGSGLHPQSLRVQTDLRWEFRIHHLHPQFPPDLLETFVFEDKSELPSPTHLCQSHKPKIWRNCSEQCLHEAYRCAIPQFGRVFNHGYHSWRFSASARFPQGAILRGCRGHCHREETALSALQSNLIRLLEPFGFFGHSRLLRRETLITYSRRLKTKTSFGLV